MPEISLPGIDTTPAATPATPSTPSGDDTGAPSQRTEDTAATSPGAERATSQDVATSGTPGEHGTEDALNTDTARRGRRNMQTRVDELIADRTSANQRAERAEVLLQQVVSGLLTGKQGVQQAAEAGIGQGAEPKKGDYADVMDYIAAKATYDAEKRIMAQLRGERQTEQQQREQHETRQRSQRFHEAQTQLHNVFSEQMRAAETLYPDFREVISDAPFEIPLRVEAAAVSSGHGGVVAYYFAKNPQVMAQLERLPDLLLGQQVARIVQHMRSSSASSSNAPEPGRPAGNRGSGPMEYPKDATPEQHLAWMNRNKPASTKRA